MKWTIDDRAVEEKPVKLTLEIKPSEAKEIAAAIADSGFFPSYNIMAYSSPYPGVSARDEMLKALRAVAKM